MLQMRRFVVDHFDLAIFRISRVPLQAVVSEDSLSLFNLDRIFFLHASRAFHTTFHGKRAHNGLSSPVWDRKRRDVIDMPPKHLIARETHFSNQVNEKLRNPFRRKSKKTEEAPKQA